MPLSRILRLRIKTKVTAVSFPDPMGRERSWEISQLTPLFRPCQKTVPDKCGLEINTSGESTVGMSLTNQLDYPDTSDFVN